jgi:DtxR family Mn-dependent transcriptional regulator
MSQGKSSVWKDFDKNEVTHSVTHYLFAIDSLVKDNWYARAVDIAKKLDITAGSCSTWIKWILKKWLAVEDQNKFLRLSPHGLEIVEKITKTRNTFETFFLEKLWASEKLAKSNACKIEHLINEEITDLLVKHLHQ